MSSDYTGNLQAAIFSALRAASPIIAGGRIFDAVPVGIDSTDSNFPYVVIGETQAIADDTSAPGSVSDDGVVGYVTLHVWSRYRGKAEVHAVASQIKGALHEVDLTVIGRASALCWIDSTIVMDDPDGITRHGIVTCRVIHRT